MDSVRYSPVLATVFGADLDCFDAHLECSWCSSGLLSVLLWTVFGARLDGFGARLDCFQY